MMIPCISTRGRVHLKKNQVWLGPSYSPDCRLLVEPLFLSLVLKKRTRKRWLRIIQSSGAFTVPTVNTRRDWCTSPYPRSGQRSSKEVPAIWQSCDFILQKKVTSELYIWTGEIGPNRIFTLFSHRRDIRPSMASHCWHPRWCLSAVGNELH